MAAPGALSRPRARWARPDMASLGLDLGDDDMLNDGNDGSAPLAEGVDGTAPLLPSASAGTSGEGGAADASEAAAANGLDERLRTTVPMFQAAGTLSPSRRGRPRRDGLWRRTSTRQTAPSAAGASCTIARGRCRPPGQPAG